MPFLYQAHSSHLQSTACHSQGLRTQTVKFALPQKRPGGRGGGEGAVLGVGASQQPTTAAISMFSNLKPLAPTKSLASIQHGFKVAPKLFLTVTIDFIIN